MRLPGFLLAFLVFANAGAAELGQQLSRFTAGGGARCDIKLWIGAAEGNAQWESRVLAKGDRLRIHNRRVGGDVEPGPEELLWTGDGAVQFMGGHPSTFLPGEQLSMAEAYLLVEFLVPLWSASGEVVTGMPTIVEGPLGEGNLTLGAEGNPILLVVDNLSRPLWTGSTKARVSFEESDVGAPWSRAMICDKDGNLLAVLERVRFRRSSLSDDLFSLDEESGIRLADLSKPLGQLVGSEDGEYTETAGVQGLREGSTSGSGGGAAYEGYRPTADEVDRFLRDGKLGRYGDGG